MRAWVNGQLVANDEASVSVFDHGFTVGDGVFETLIVKAGQPFALTRHLARLIRSATGMGLAPIETAEVAEAVARTLSANETLIPELARLRITYSSGSGQAGSERGEGPNTLTVTLQPAASWPDTTTAIRSPWPRNERSPLAGVKSTSYAENAISLAWARKYGFSEALLANLAGQLCEGTGTNVFVVMDGQLVTPPLASGCLAGVTRELVLEWCGAQERELPGEVLDTADEIFLTSSTRDVHPIVAIGDRELAVGPQTKVARETFIRFAGYNVDP